MKFLPAILTPMLLFYSLANWAGIDAEGFESEQLRQRYQVLVSELRCPKCQNQNLAGSDSPIAGDLRREIRRLLHEGSSDREITDYLVARYGDFVLYRPRWQATTYLLWSAPLVLLLIAVMVLFIVVRRRAGSGDFAQLSAEEQAALNRVLEADQSQATNWSQAAKQAQTTNPAQAVNKDRL